MNGRGSSVAAWSWPQGAAVVLLVALLLASFAIRCERIVENAPYPRHVDEETFLKNSLGMIARGSARPTTLNWPSLPLYLAAGAHLVGYAWDRDPDLGRGLSDISTRAFPFYQQQGMVLAAKLFFASLSLATLGFVALIAFWITRSWLAPVLAAGVLCLNPLYFYHSWSYLNVDIVGTFFIVAGVCYLVVWGDDRRTLLHKSIIPGIFCGLAAACKYPNGALALPFVISIALMDWKKLPLYGAVLFAFLGFSFALAMPYALIEPNRMLTWMAKQREIYSEGWPGYTVEAGLPHLAQQLQHLVESYGQTIVALGLFGLGVALVRGGRKGIALASYPIFFTLYYSSYRVDLVRNLLAVQALFAVFAALGAITLCRVGAERLATMGVWSNRRDQAFVLVASLLIATLLAGAPWSELRAGYFTPRDSRHGAVEWIEENLPKGSRLVVARELRFDVRPLMTRYIVDPRFLMRKHGAGGTIQRANADYLQFEAERGSYFVVPEFGWRAPWPEREALSRFANRQLSGGEQLATFGTHPVPVEYFETVPDGDPQFTIRLGNLIPGSVAD